MCMFQFHIKHMKYEKRHCLQLLQQNTMRVTVIVYSQRLTIYGKRYLTKRYLLLNLQHYNEDRYHIRWLSVMFSCLVVSQIDNKSFVYLSLYNSPTYCGNIVKSSKQMQTIVLNGNKYIFRYFL